MNKQRSFDNPSVESVEVFMQTPDTGKGLSRQMWLVMPACLIRMMEAAGWRVIEVKAIV